MEAGKSIKAGRRRKAGNSRAVFLVSAAVSIIVCLTVAVIAAGKGGQEVEQETAGRVKQEVKKPEPEETVMEESWRKTGTRLGVCQRTGAVMM